MHIHVPEKFVSLDTQVVETINNESLNAATIFFIDPLSDHPLYDDVDPREIAPSNRQLIVLCNDNEYPFTRTQAFEIAHFFNRMACEGIEQVFIPTPSNSAIAEAFINSFEQLRTQKGKEPEIVYFSSARSGNSNLYNHISTTLEDLFIAYARAPFFPEKVLPIDTFDGSYRFLSNFANFPLKINGICFPTSEHVYSAMKTTNIEERRYIATLRSPGEAKRYGRKLAVRPEWDRRNDGSPGIKFDIMRHILKAKFSQHPVLAKKLLATGDTELLEGNTWGDMIWGVDHQTGKGANHLGIMLMDRRSVLREERDRSFPPVERALQFLERQRDILGRTQ